MHRMLAYQMVRWNKQFPGRSRELKVKTGLKSFDTVTSWWSLLRTVIKKYFFLFARFDGGAAGSLQNV